MIPEKRKMALKTKNLIVFIRLHRLLSLKVVFFLRFSGVFCLTRTLFLINELKSYAPRESIIGVWEAEFFVSNPPTSTVHPPSPSFAIRPNQIPQYLLYLMSLFSSNN
jgi:hypothetical protein